MFIDQEQLKTSYLKLVIQFETKDINACTIFIIAFSSTEMKFKLNFYVICLGKLKLKSLSFATFKSFI